MSRSACIEKNRLAIFGHPRAVVCLLLLALRARVKGLATAPCGFCLVSYFPVGTGSGIFAHRLRLSGNGLAPPVGGPGKLMGLLGKTRRAPHR